MRSVIANWGMNADKWPLLKNAAELSQTETKKEDEPQLYVPPTAYS